MNDREFPGLPADFWARVAAASHRLLMLDYDGTLAPFEVDRAKAVADRAVLDCVRRLATNGDTRVVVVSGRPVRELLSLLGSLPIELVGEHGWEGIRDGKGWQFPLLHRWSSPFAQAATAAISSGLGNHLERKRASIVLHTRGLSSSQAREVESFGIRVWAEIALRHGLRLMTASSGVELRVPGRHKGTVVRESVAGCSFGTLPVYVGDDATDEDAFREVRERGVGIRVAHEPRETEASGVLASCTEVGRFLLRWEAVVTLRVKGNVLGTTGWPE